MPRDPHALEPTPGETVELPSGEALIILGVEQRTELGYSVRTVGNDRTTEIYRASKEWRTVSQMFDYPLRKF